MALFTQPVNREAQLKTVLDGYADVLQKDWWLSEALQKDSIQNAWDARLNKHGEGWRVNISLWNNFSNKGKVIVVDDMGTSGLVGTIPNTKEELTAILKRDDPEEKEKLAFFLSQDFSKKVESSLGARGRGKIIFLGASGVSKIYFETVRLSDHVYIFGALNIDINKEVQVEYYPENEGVAFRERSGLDAIPLLESVGTRIIILSPKKEIVDAIENGQMESQIRETWWEILSKFNAQICLGLNNNFKKIESSPWLPIANSEINEVENSDPIEIEPGIKIKKISLCYLGDKSIQSSYLGLAIQRRGMCVERTRVSSFNPSIQDDLIYGSVEFDEKLDDKMKDSEGPEHCSFIWNRGIAPKVKKAIKVFVNQFAEKYDILHATASVPRKQREAEIQAQKELNKLADKLGFTGLNSIKKKRKKKKINPAEKIFLSVPDFETPYENGRADLNQEIKGTYFFPVSKYGEHLRVLIKVWVIREGEFEVKGLRTEKEIIIGKDLPLEKIGWDNILIDSRFSKGTYYLKATITALENREFDDGKVVETGNWIYHEVKKPFYVEEDPKDSGFFEVIREESGDKGRYFRWEEREDTCALIYNALHPKLKDIVKDELLLKETIKNEGILILATILFINADSGNADIPSIYVKQVNELRSLSMEEKINWIFKLRSEFLWVDK